MKSVLAAKIDDYSLILETAYRIEKIEALPAASCGESSQYALCGIGSILISLANPAASHGVCARLLVLPLPYKEVDRCFKKINFVTDSKPLRRRTARKRNRVKPRSQPFAPCVGRGWMRCLGHC